MIFTLLKRDISTIYKTFLILFALMCMYTIVIIYMFDPAMADMLNDYQDLMPGVMSAMGMSGMASTLLEWMQIYLYGFIMLLFPLVFIIILVHKLLMSYIDNGSMAILLSTGHSRREIILTQAFAAFIWVTLLIGAVTLVGIASAEMLFPGELDCNGYLLLNVSTWLVQLAVCGIAFACACFFGESKNYYMIGAGLPLVFFLLQMISNMGEKLENLKYLTIYTLLPAAKIVAGEGGYGGCNLALIAIAVVLFGGGMWWFTRRDLSL